MNDPIPGGKQRPSMIQVALVALPVGTVVLGVIAMIWYFQRDYIVGKRDRDGVYTKEPTVASITDYTAKLTSVITAARGARDEAGRRGLLATQSMIEGAMGETNMGYQPVVQEFTVEGIGRKNIWADNTGARNPTEIIEVRVCHGLTGNPATVVQESLRVAVALELAHAFTGTATRRTVRFLFLDGPPGDGAATTAYARLMADRRIKVIGVIDLSSGDFDGGRYVGAEGKIEGQALAAKVGELRQAIARLADQ